MSKEQDKQRTIKEFVDQNDKLISILGVFIGIFVFVQLIDQGIFAYALSILIWVIILVLWIELMEQYPSGDVNWRMILFEHAISFSFLAILLFVFVNYREFWSIGMYFFLWFLMASIVTMIVKKWVRLRRWLNLDTPPKTKWHRWASFITLTILVFGVGYIIAVAVAPQANKVLDEIKHTVDSVDVELKKMRQKQ